MIAKADGYLRSKSYYLFVGFGILAFVLPGPGLFLNDLQFGHLSVGNLPLPLNFWTLIMVICFLPAALRFSISDIQNLILAPRSLAVGLGLIFGIAPVLAKLFSAPLHLIFEPAEAAQLSVGFAILAASPISAAAVYWINPLRGDLSFATAMVAFSFVMTPLSVPAVLYFIQGADDFQIGLNPLQLIGSLVIRVWVPLVFMGVLKKAAPLFIENWRPLIALSATLALVTGDYIFVAKLGSVMVSSLSVSETLLIGAWVSIFICCVFSASYFLAWLAGASRMERITNMYLASMRATGPVLSVDLATICAHTPLVTLPALFALGHHLIGRAIFGLLLKRASQRADNLGLQIVDDLFVDYQVVLDGDLGPKFWPQGARPTGDWPRANVQDLTSSGATSIGKLSIPAGTVAVIRLYHEKLSFPLEVKAVRAWEQTVVDNSDIYVGHFRFLHVSEDWLAVLNDFLAEPRISEQMKKRSKGAIAA